MKENAIDKSGIPTFLRGGVLLRREAEIPFSFLIKISAHVDIGGLLCITSSANKSSSRFLQPWQTRLSAKDPKGAVRRHTGGRPDKDGHTGSWHPG